MYDELARWRLRQEEATPGRIDYIFDTLWDRGKEELRLLGHTSFTAKRLAREYVSTGISSGVLSGENPVLITGITREPDGRAITWFQATDEFTRYVEPITRLMRHECECFGQELSIYSVCVHPQTEKWFRILGFKLDGWMEKLPTGGWLRRFVRPA